MLVRGVAGPVASRGDDLDDEQSLCGLALHEDIPDLPLVGPRPARAHLDVLRPDKARLYPPPGRGGGDRKLQIRRSLDTVLRRGGQVDGVGKTVEGALSLPDFPPLVLLGEYVAPSGENHEAALLAPRIPLQGPARVQPNHLETDVLPPRRPGGYPEHAPIHAGLFLAGNYKISHA